jgi:hypothetical protein
MSGPCRTGEKIVIFRLVLLEQRIKRADGGASLDPIACAVQHVKPRLLLVLAFEIVKPVPYLPEEREVVGEDEKLSGILRALTDKSERKIQCIGVKA